MSRPLAPLVDQLSMLHYLCVCVYVCACVCAAPCCFWFTHMLSAPAVESEIIFVTGLGPPKVTTSGCFPCSRTNIRYELHGREDFLTFIAS